MSDSSPHPVLRPARLAEILPLRHAVLLPGRPVETARFDGDHDPATRHYGAFLPDGRAVACASLMAAAWQGAAAWQLRGMATDPAFQRQGLGRRLLEFIEADLAAAGGPFLLWCNARLGAVAFYERMGWTVVSERFEIDGVGPHVRMTRRV